MSSYSAIAAFVIIALVMFVLMILLLFYINSWLCFKKLPRFWCFENNYEELSSIPETEDEKSRWRNVADLDSNAGNDDMDLDTVAAHEIAKRGMIVPDDDNRSEGSDELIEMFGTVVVGFKYEIEKTTLHCNISNVTSLPTKKNGGASAYQLITKLIDDKGHSLKKWHSPMFDVYKFPTNQKFHYSNLLPANVQKTALRLRIYGYERKKRHSLLGETTVGLISINLERHSLYRIKLESRAVVEVKDKAELQDEDPFIAEMKEVKAKVIEPVGNQPELLLGLAYNKVNGRLTINIIKGNAFKNPLSRSDDDYPNTLAKITLCATNTQEIAKSKTSCRLKSDCPLFKEKFTFHVPYFQLEEISVVISVYHKKSVHRREVIGWFSIGVHNSSDEETSHWESMLEAKGESIVQWHLLQPNTKSRHGLPGAE